MAAAAAAATAAAKGEGDDLVVALPEVAVWFGGDCDDELAERIERRAADAALLAVRVNDRGEGVEVTRAGAKYSHGSISLREQPKRAGSACAGHAREGRLRQRAAWPRYALNVLPLRGATSGRYISVSFGRYVRALLRAGGWACAVAGQRRTVVYSISASQERVCCLRAGEGRMAAASAPAGGAGSRERDVFASACVRGACTQTASLSICFVRQRARPHLSATALLGFRLLRSRSTSTPPH